MGTMMFLYENFADGAILGGGSWQIPLTAMQDPRPTRRARSTNVDPASTTWHVPFVDAKTFRAVAFGPTNMSPGARYRVRAWNDAAHSDMVFDNGWEIFGPPPAEPLSIEWEDPRFWLLSQSFDDPDNAGVWAISVFPADVTAQHWTYEIEDPGNPDGYIEIGRLYMGNSWTPPWNFAPDSNELSFDTNTTMQVALGGTRYYNRRKAQRKFKFAWPVLPTDEAWTHVYRIALLAGIDKQVFIISDPDDLLYRNKRSFLANLDTLPSISLMQVENATTGFAVTEAI